MTKKKEIIKKEVLKKISAKQIGQNINMVVGSKTFSKRFENKEQRSFIIERIKEYNQKPNQTKLSKLISDMTINTKENKKKGDIAKINNIKAKKKIIEKVEKLTTSKLEEEVKEQGKKISTIESVVNKLSNSFKEFVNKFSSKADSSPIGKSFRGEN